MSAALLAREAELHRRNADLDAAVAKAKMSLVVEAPTPPRHSATSVSHNDSFASCATPPRRDEGFADAPLSPSVRAAATASAARRSLIPKPGRAAVATAQPSMPDADAAITLLENVDPALPAEIQLRMLRSQLKIARKMRMGKFDQRTAGRAVTQRVQEAEKLGSVEGAERARLAKALAASEAALEKAKRACEAADAREGDLRAQLAAAKRESQDVVKASRAAEASSSALDTRLARATEDAERARAQLQAERADAAEREKDLRSKCEALGVQLKRAERQRSELLVAFKKQLRLIDVLKRQRIHMEAARLLSFTEEEFMRALSTAAAALPSGAAS